MTALHHFLLSVSWDILFLVNIIIGHDFIIISNFYIFFVYLKVLLIFDNIIVYNLAIEEYSIIYFY